MQGLNRPTFSFSGPVVDHFNFESALCMCIIAMHCISYFEESVLFCLHYSEHKIGTGMLGTVKLQRETLLSTFLVG